MAATGLVVAAIASADAMDFLGCAGRAAGPAASALSPDRDRDDASLDRGRTTTSPPPPTTTTTAPATTTGSPSPSTVPPAPAAPGPRPGGDGPTAAASRGWELVASDEMDGASVDTGRWELYDSAGNGGVGLRRPSAISQSGGELRITGRGDVSGGMAWRGGQTFGRWEVRARSDLGNGYAPAILLWPDSGNWPEDGEIDITEIPLGDRRESHFTLHWGADNSQTGFATSGDFTAWHTFAVEWMPDHITFFLDGEPLYTNDDPAAIPRGPMHLAIQHDVGPYNWIPGRDASTPAEVSLHVDWVRIYSP